EVPPGKDKECSKRIVGGNAARQGSRKYFCAVVRAVSLPRPLLVRLRFYIRNRGRRCRTAAHPAREPDDVTEDVQPERDRDHVADHARAAKKADPQAVFLLLRAVARAGYQREAHALAGPLRVVVHGDLRSEEHTSELQSREK